MIPKLPNSFEEAEQFQRLFVTPLVNAVKTEMANHVEKVTAIVTTATTKVDGMENRVTRLESSQKKALAGFALYATGLSLLIGSLWGWIKSKIHWN